MLALGVREANNISTGCALRYGSIVHQEMGSRKADVEVLKHVGICKGLRARGMDHGEDMSRKGFLK